MIAVIAVVIIIIAAVPVYVYATGDHENNEESERTITDLGGAEVTLPAADELDRVVILSPPLMSFTLSLISPDRIVGVSGYCLQYTNTAILEKIFPNYKSVKTDFVESSMAQTINKEALMALNPDVILYYGTNQIAGIEDIGVPMVNFLDTTVMCNPEPVTLSWDKLLREVFDVPGESILEDKWAEIDAKCEKLVSGIPESQKKSAMAIFSNAGGSLMISGTAAMNSCVEYQLAKTGLKMVDVGFAGSKVVSMEDVLKWNPDVAFVFMGSASAILSNSVTGQDWSNLTAYKNGDIYDTPKGGYSWYMPSSDAPLMDLWLISIAYPELYSHADMVADLIDYVDDVYDVTLTADQANAVLGY